MTVDAPLPPAEAYYEVARILGDDWFLKPPPAQGVTVIIQGRDHLLTEWAVDLETAVALKPKVLACPGLRWFGQRPYFSTPGVQP